MTVENGMQDAIFTIMDKVVILRFELAVWSITGSSGHGPNIVVQHADRRDFMRKTENTRIMSASSRLDLNNDQVRIDETRDFENLEDGAFLALRHNYDRWAHVHRKNLQTLNMLLGLKWGTKKSKGGKWQIGVPEPIHWTTKKKTKSETRRTSISLLGKYW